MRIGELARQTGLSTSTLRYYERRGIIVPTSRTASGYRDYPAEAITTAHLVQWLKALGFTLREIGEYYQLVIQHGSVVHAGTLRSHAAAKATEIDERIRGLTSVRDKLQELAACRCRAAGQCPLVRRASNGPIQNQTRDSEKRRRPASRRSLKQKTGLVV